MRKWLWAALLGLPLVAVAGLAYANSQKAASGGFVCPLTGQELPCPKCCPMNP
jgi:hypothetical protein